MLLLIAKWNLWHDRNIMNIISFPALAFCLFIFLFKLTAYYKE